jgi:hypothetical protein
MPRIARFGSLRTRLILSFILVIVCVSTLAVFTGNYFIQERIVRQAQNKVIQDLNSARLIYQSRLKQTGDLIRLSADRFFKDSFFKNQEPVLKLEFYRIFIQEKVDFLTLTDERGVMIYRAGHPDQTTNQLNYPWILTVLKNRRLAASSDS